MAAWNIRPIASALWRNRTGALLVAFQIAIGLAVLVNAVYIVKQRVDKIGRPTGMDTANMIWVASAGFAKGLHHDAAWREDLATIRSIPGVHAASIFSNIPLSGGGSSSGFRRNRARRPRTRPSLPTPTSWTNTPSRRWASSLARAGPSRQTKSCPPSKLSTSGPKGMSPGPSPRNCSPKNPNRLGKSF